MADPAPTEPYDATVEGVRALLPHATIPDSLPAGGRGVTTSHVAAWLAELSGRVDLRLAGWRRLRVARTEQEESDNHPSPSERFTAAARDLVHNGAASYTEAARYPERAGVTDTSYAAVLWNRYTSGLDDLEAWLTDELATGDEGEVDPETGTAYGDPGYSFPEPFPWSGVRF